MKIKRVLMLTLLLALLLSACAASTAIPGPAVPTAAADSGVVAGRILSANTGQPFQGEYVFLAEVNYNNEGKGAFFLDSIRSPGTQSDQDGYFRFTAVPPKDYVLVVGNPDGNPVAITDKSKGEPKVWKVEAGKVVNMGDVRFDVPK